ncbi:hypothetical protein [Pseudonocardia abyssalis]|uniref:Uncharacterized protein n=1 Tax=Pseudonocardia abyssalis TaxID=2792008 RepID=A0ABS6UQY1_9PSEU|nr:hypothetical protein [Pseudonocardia abyssalis]MBW0134662.1 hypothetical protein [Pseudonocardia abyssalis]
MLDRVAGDGPRPVSAIGITVGSVFVDCAASLKRSGLWEPESWGRVEAPAVSEVVRGHLELTAPVQ